MRSLFVRLLLSLWLAMAVLLGLFALIHAWAFPAQFGPRHAVTERNARLRGLEALDCLGDAPSEAARCAALLEPLDRRDQRVAVYRDGALVLGEPFEGAAELAREATERGASVSSAAPREELAAVVLDHPAAGRHVVVGRQPRPSRWFIFFTPETLPYRLLAIVLVSGLVSVLLARYLSRPLRTLRRATERLADGDLSVRVAPELRHADAETRALGEDMDRMAERVDELLDAQRRLLRDVSHELRSPLARLGLALELLRRKATPELEPALDRIARESDRLAVMIGELLTLSRLESKASLEGVERIELGGLVDEVVADVAFEAESRRVSVALERDGAFAVDGNEELLRRAVENVLRNAVRFTTEGSSVEVRLDAIGAEARLRVRDHGPGVPEEALGKLFEPFYRVADDRARGHGGGAGIGLAITQGAVALHQGSTLARNAEGGGLLVELRLPLCSAPARAGERAISSPAA